ncbi:uncharacterized protein LOC124407233 [Diprion similis]|uniref:uncharacterized protein LOC124407233 n=1 Tax=Diprion similis TaxID=362088 RepID=UPI001EF794D2|nr:uncharacterized protein LOC124407233 [Diprion similis]
MECNSTRLHLSVMFPNYGFCFTVIVILAVLSNQTLATPKREPKCCSKLAKSARRGLEGFNKITLRIVSALIKTASRLWKYIPECLKPPPPIVKFANTTNEYMKRKRPIDHDAICDDFDD